MDEPTSYAQTFNFLAYFFKLASKIPKEKVDESMKKENSRAVLSSTRETLEESIKEVYNDKVFLKCLRIADLGCSSGPNTLTLVSYIIDIIQAICQCSNKIIKSPTFQVFLNDLPGNDFNVVFQSLSNFYERLEKEKGDDFGPCFIAAMPGSFYGRLFPNNSMHSVHSSYSLHWLSQVPKELLVNNNKGNIYISKTSPPLVFKAYLDQFHKDFTNFLRWRSEEIEVVEVESVVQEVGSFSVQKLNSFEMAWDAGFTSHEHNSNNEKFERGKYVSDYVRAAAEPILVKQFGKTVMEELFKRIADKVTESMAKEKWQYLNLVISLTKN
ncbi:probable caffeine synthase MTL3 [Humulus lupulus]|uniref:probable caffeine synthase MTL3 n=1 Tax=Humulus lupulus TaxID=3486 RepID=UPI002B4041A9|nr:probable caffeine synthase MTL3 [Humulus lupulus]